ncbi:methyl-accepting chemotaxis protein [Comamonas sp. GB3 AK4-5]|uniref:methyl-accepting chemotaxis protein n=1 Tax=Comamonas sp. GB3 AK4-5 TaxID=3231487 RepID=UPI00351E3114
MQQRSSERNTMGVKKQLTLGFGLLAALVLLVALVAVRALSTTNESFTHYNENVAAQSQLATRLADAVNARAMAARNLVLVRTLADVELEKAAVTKAHASTQALLQQLQQAVAQQGSSEHRAMVERIAQIESRYGPVALEIVEKASLGEQDAAIEKMNAECRPLLAALLGAIQGYVDANAEEGNQAVAAAEQRYSSARLQLLAASIFAVLAAMALGGWIIRNLFAALGGEPQEAVCLARAVAQGDLSTAVQLRQGDGESLMATLHTMQQELATVVSNVRQNARGVASASEGIDSGNTDLNARTEQQAAALEETAASMAQLGATVRQNADNAQSANQLAVAASSVAVQGGEVVMQVVNTMKGINTSSQRIADIIGVIDSIAFQTNILALNAAVEAARAGEQGRGFAVVAGEVRILAQRSASAAKEIKALIDASVEQTEQGSKLVDQAGSTMQDVVSSIRRVTDIMGEISAASHEQSQGVAQVGEAITQMEQGTQQNAGLVEQSAQGARQLRDRAGELVHAVGVFRLPPHMLGDREASPVRPVHAPRMPSGMLGAARPVALRTAPALPAARAKVAAPATADAEWESF